MKILIFNEYYYPYHKGGAEISTQLLAESLVELGNEVTVCCSCDKDWEQLYNGVKILYRKYKNIYWSYKSKNHSALEKMLWHSIDCYNFFNRKIVEDVISKESPQIIHTNNLSGFSCIVWNIAKKKKIKVCHTLRDYYLMCPSCTMYKNKECNSQCVKCKMLSYSKRLMSKNVDSVIGISNFILDRHLRNSYFEGCVYTGRIANPVALRETVQLPQAKMNRIGYLGSLSENKGVQYLIDSFLSVCGDKYELCIAGEGTTDYEVYIKNKYKSNKNVKFLGKQNSSSFLSTIDLLVVPSLWNEPFGRVVIEALGNNVPVLGSDKGGISDILKNYPENSMLFEPTCDGLKNLLRRYFSGNLEFSRNSSEKIRQEYNPRTIAKEYQNVYYQLVNE